MISFECDYNNGAAKKIIEAMCLTNGVSQPGYGNDEYTIRAVRKIRKAVENSEAYVSFSGGGTQTNQLVISTMLRRSEAVISADTGHINVHESGAIEYTGHKVISLRNRDGKLSPPVLKSYMEEYMDSEPKSAMVTPRMVYLSQPTEIGTLYTADELFRIREICDEYSLLLYVDGARLAYALAAPGSDVTLPLLSALCDVFYIGGTKCGALCGEAIVFKKDTVPEGFEQMKKQEGALFAKGRLLGVQFDALFTDDYYLELGKEGIAKAMKLKAVFERKGYAFAWNSPTNQQFVIMDDAKMESLMKSVRFERWQAYDGQRSVVRFCTSWSTLDEEIEELEKLL